MREREGGRDGGREGGGEGGGREVGRGGREGGREGGGKRGRGGGRERFSRENWISAGLQCQTAAVKILRGIKKVGIVMICMPRLHNTYNM